MATRVVDHRAYAERAAFDAALAAEIDALDPDLVVLAGFMRILTDPFVARYAGRLVNIHPSLLPAFPGLHTHRRALEAGVRIHGCTVHFVTPSSTAGRSSPRPQSRCCRTIPRKRSRRACSRRSTGIYPQAVRWICEGRVGLAPDGRVTVRQAGTPAGSLASPPLDRHER